MKDRDPSAEKEVSRKKKRRSHRDSLAEDYATDGGRRLTNHMHLASNLSPNSAIHLAAVGGRTPADLNHHRDLVDYVLVYKLKEEHTSSKGNKQKDGIDANQTTDGLREAFERYLKRNGLEVSEERAESEKEVFVKLRCSFKRLACEAERIRLELPLKDLPLNSCTSRCYTFLDKFFKTDDEVDYISAPFEQSKGDKFLHFEDENKFFRPALRSLLVHSILTNVGGEADDTTDSGDATPNKVQQAWKKGLPYLLMEGVYSDAFILHDKSKEPERQTCAPSRLQPAPNPEFNENSEIPAEEQSRIVLDNTWPRPLLYQPVWKIRNYFGEEIALYFAWMGLLTWSITVPAFFGLSIFLYGIWLSVWSQSNRSDGTILTANTNASSFYTIVQTTSASLTSNGFGNFTTTALQQSTTVSIITQFVTYGEDLLYTIEDALDNDITPWYSIVVCIWGTIFLELWKRRNSVLAYEWDVDQYEANEINRPQYVGQPRKDRVTGEQILYYPKRMRAAKIAVSLSSVIMMACVVIIVTIAVMAYRVIVGVDYCKSKKWDSVTCTVMTSLVATVSNAIIIMVLSWIYEKLAYALTDWENHRTETDYKDALIVKLFAFLFTNSFASLYYIAFFRGDLSITGGSGIFGLNSSYVDSCTSISTDTSCMSMLSLQVLVLIILKPLMSTLKEVLTPVLKALLIKIKRTTYCKTKKDATSSDLETGKNSFLDLLEQERAKPPLGNFTLSQYTDKVIQYGYLMLFAVSMPLAPLIVLLANIVDRYIDSKRMLWKYRRPVAFQAQDIGTWYYTLEFLNICGVITNACLIAFTSKWGDDYLDTGCNKLVFILAYEHCVFAVKYFIAAIIPDVPNHIKRAIRRKKYLIAKAMHSGQFTKQLSDPEQEEEDQVLEPASPAPLRPIRGNARIRSSLDSSTPSSSRDDSSNTKRMERRTSRVAGSEMR